jgi:hypothetical protein
MANTYTLIEAQTLGSSAASVTFSSIPATYTDLKLVGSTRTTRNVGSVSNLYLQVNSITSAVYTIKQLSGTGSAADNNTASNVVPTSASVGHTSQSTDTANTFGNFEFYIPNYAGSNNKSLSSDAVQENDASAAYSSLTAWLMANTAAITSLTLTTTATFSFVQYSSFYLYGIKNS